MAWLTRPDGTGRTELVWPRGFSARFAPELEILDASGAVVARAGDHVSGGCVESLSPVKVVRIDPLPNA